MERKGCRVQQWRITCWGILIVSQFFMLADCGSLRSLKRWAPVKSPQDVSSSPLRLQILQEHVVMENGIVKLTLTKPHGLIGGIEYGGVSNVLEYRLIEPHRGYWDIVWSRPEDGISHFWQLEGTTFKVIAAHEDKIEVSFSRKWDSPQDNTSLPLNFDTRYIMLRGQSGFYTYSIFEHPQGWPDLNIDETRVAFKLQQDLFHYMAISDENQRIMPSGYDREDGKVLDYREAVLLTNPSNPALRGEVDDKYQYSMENKDNRVHGWISSAPHVGFWVINPSDESRAGGPVKQDLTSHVGPTSLAVFFSGHYAGDGFGIRLRNGEPWKKVFGPAFIYLNSDSGNDNQALWKDAKQQMFAETIKWPYDFPLSEDYPHTNQRGTVTGRLMIRDRYISKDLIPAKSGYVGLAPPGEVGSWQLDAKGYQYWNQTNDQGYFTISGARPGTYNLYAWVPGVLGDYKYEIDIEIRPGYQLSIGDLTYDPPRNGPTLWEIGIPDRSAAEFYVPDASPGYSNHLFINRENFRQYGLWNRYTDLYPSQDLVYRVGVSNYTKDWFFAHVNRKLKDKTMVPATWQIIFPLQNVTKTGTYTLRLAIAAATYAELQVRINTPQTRAIFSTRGIGRDNAIARHGIHGLHWFYSVDIPGSLLVNGNNTIFLKQSRAQNLFVGLMYDYIRLEGLPQTKY